MYTLCQKTKKKPDFFGRQPSRGFMIGVQRFVLVGVIATTFLLLQNIQRRAIIQHFYIKRRLKQPTKIEFPIPVMKREEEETHLTGFLKSNPGRPLVIVGAGSGKSWAIKNLINNKPMTVLLDIKIRPISTANELIYLFIHSTSYLLPSSGYLVRWLLKEKDLEKRPRILRDNIEKGFLAIKTVLETLKREGWRDGIPVFVITDIEASGIKENDQEFSKLVNFLMSLSENGLAHFVFTSTLLFSNQTLDSYSGWRSRRELYYFSQANTEEVSKYLSNDLTHYFSKNSISKINLSQEEIEYIGLSLGGASDDISSVIISLGRNLSLEDQINRLIMESVQLVKSTLEYYSKDSSTYSQYLHLWELMLMFKEENMNPISRATLINSIFKDEWEELDFLESQGIVQFHQNKRQNQSLSLDYIKLLMENRGLDNEINSHFILVSPSRQRMKIAFWFVLLDSHMIAQTERIQRKYKKKKLQKELDEHLLVYDRLQSRKSFALSEQENFLRYLEPLKSIVGKDSLDTLLVQHNDLLNRLKDEEVNLQAIDNEIKQINQDLKSLE